MKLLSKNEILDLITSHKADTDLNLKEISLCNCDLSHTDFSHIDFSWCDFKNVDFRYCKFHNSVLDYAKFSKCDLSFSSFEDASLISTDLRGCKLAFSNCKGANFYASILWQADMEGLVQDEHTQFLRNYCPQSGYILGYKKCFNDRMVTLLIPKEARRCSSTTRACRCDMAKVIAITDTKRELCFNEAISFVDANFIYKLGEMVHADSYNEDRWLDSSHGIHFWMSFEEALGYM